MFQNVSMTGTGLALLLLNLIIQTLALFGIKIDILPDQLNALVNDASQMVSIVLMVWGQLRRSDLVGGIIRVKHQ